MEIRNILNQITEELNLKTIIANDIEYNLSVGIHYGKFNVDVRPVDCFNEDFDICVTDYICWYVDEFDHTDTLIEAIITYLELNESE